MKRPLMTLSRDKHPILLVSAPAKINLFLELIGRRKDGFHELETLMAPISLYDSIRFKASENDQISLSGRFDLPLNYLQQASVYHEQGFWNEKNLVWQAAELIKDYCGISAGIRIDLIKRIPAQAGLGGASSDAAATLIALNRIWKAGLNSGQLLDLASRLGSDVPFFLQPGYALCRGRGELVEPFANAHPIHIVVCKPPIGLSTADIFRKCELGHDLQNSIELQAALAKGNVYQAGQKIKNRLQEFARPRTEWIKILSYQFSQVGSLGYQMSGSGTSFFGIFANLKSALRAANCLSSRLPTTFVFVGHTLAPRRS